MSTVWLNDLSSANLLRKTYISGFLDISGGDMNLRSGNFFTGGTITQNTDSANVDVPSYSMFSVTDLSYMFASITAPMTTFAQDITTNGNTVVKKNLLVTNDASLGGKLALVGDASLNSRLFLGGDASLNSRLFLAGDASLNSTLSVAGDVSLNSKLTVAGDASLNSKLTVAGDVSLSSKLRVAGDASLNSKLTVAGDASLNGNVGFSPSTSIYGGTISGITNDLHVYGLNVGAGDASLNSKLSVAGDASLNSKLSVVGDVSMNSNLYIFGKTSAIGAVDISGNVAIGKTSAGVALDVSGSALVNGNVGIGKTTANAVLDVSGGVLVSGNVAIGKTTADFALDVSGSVSIGGNVVMVPSFSGVNTVTPNTTDVSGNNTWTKNGIGWRSSQSSVFSSSMEGCYAFDTILATSSRYVSAGDSAGNARYTTTAGASFGNATTNAAITSVSINGGVSENIRGEYLQISASAKLKITQFTLATSNDNNSFPRSYYLVGSNDGSTWTSIQRGESSLTTFTLANNTTIANPIPIGLPSTTATVTYPGSTNTNALNVTNHNGASDYYSMFRFIATATINPVTTECGLELGEWTPTFTLQSDTLTLSSNASTTNNMGLNVDGLVSCTRGYQLSYTTLPTYTANHIGFTVSGRSANAASPTLDIVIANPGVYMLTWWYWLVNAGSGTGYVEATCTDVSTSVGNNSTIDGVNVHSNIIYASGANWQGGQNMMRILRPSTANKTYYLRTAYFAYTNTNAGNYINYMYVRIA